MRSLANNSEIVGILYVFPMLQKNCGISFSMQLFTKQHITKYRSELALHLLTCPSQVHQLLNPVTNRRVGSGPKNKHQTKDKETK